MSQLHRPHVGLHVGTVQEDWRVELSLGPRTRSEGTGEGYLCTRSRSQREKGPESVGPALSEGMAEARCTPDFPFLPLQPGPRTSWVWASCRAARVQTPSDRNAEGGPSQAARSASFTRLHSAPSRTMGCSCRRVPGPRGVRKQVLRAGGETPLSTSQPAFGTRCQGGPTRVLVVTPVTPFSELDVIVLNQYVLNVCYVRGARSTGKVCGTDLEGDVYSGATDGKQTMNYLPHRSGGSSQGG